MPPRKRVLLLDWAGTLSWLPDPTGFISKRKEDGDRVFLVSGNPEEAFRQERGLEQILDGVVLKPFGLEELHATLGEIEEGLHVIFADDEKPVLTAYRRLASRLRAEG